MERVLILARRRAARREGPAATTESLSLEAWETRYGDAIEGIDHAFDNGAGAFAAIAQVADRAALERLLAEYPYAAWVDFETRPLPRLSAGERRPGDA